MKQIYSKSFILFLLFTSVLLRAQVYEPVEVTGFTIDAIVENAPVSSFYTGSLDGTSTITGNILYTQAYASTASFAGGLPNNGVITDGTRNFHMQPYNQPNARRLFGGNAGTFELVTPKAYTTISLLGFSTDGNLGFSAEIQFADGTNQVQTGSYEDWFSTNNTVLGAVGRIYSSSGGTDNDSPLTRPNLQKFDIVLSGANQYKQIERIILTANASPASSITVFAVSGIPTPPITCPADIAVNNDTGQCGAVVNFAAPTISGQVKPKVLLLSNNNSYMVDVKTKLEATNEFTAVDYINVNNTIPTVAQLEQYNSVMVWTAGISGFTSPNDIAANIADYINSGGGVVIGSVDTNIQNYLPASHRVYLPSYAQTYAATLSLGTIALTAHPVIDGVTSFQNKSIIIGNPAYTTGAYLIASYNTGDVLAAAKENIGPLNSKVAALNFSFHSQDVNPSAWNPSTQGALLMTNALKWVAKGYIQTAGLASGSSFPVGTTTNTYEYTDSSGTTTCSFDIVVTDNENPKVFTQNATIELDATGNATISAADINDGSIDNCGIASMTVAPSVFNATNTGANTVVLTVTDVNGNVSTATATVYVCPRVIAPATEVCNGSTASITLSGATNYEWYSAAAGGTSFNSGNTYTTPALTADATYYVQGEYIPDPLETTFTPSYQGNGNMFNITAASDVTVTGFDVYPMPATTNVAVYYRLGGYAGFESNAAAWTLLGTAPINVTSYTPVTISVGNLALQEGQTYGIYITSTNNNLVYTSGNNSYTDNVLTIDAGIMVAYPFGGIATSRTWNGRIHYDLPMACNTRYPVTVEVNPLPELAMSSTNATCPGAADGEATVTATVGLAPYTYSWNTTPAQTTATATGLAAGTYSVTVTDDNGCIATENVIITDIDNIDPVAVAHDITVQLDATGAATITAAQIDNGSTDNCTFTPTVDITTFDCTDLGLNTVLLTITDAGGNTDTATATVTVEDSIDPVAVAHDITVQLDATGAATIMAAQIDNGSTDNCTFSLAIDNDTFDCNNVGTNNVLLTVTDGSGNIATDSAVVTVEDNVDPIVNTQDIVVQLDATGTATITVSDIDNGSSDNCAIDTMVLDVDTFDCTNVGPNNVTLTVTDVNGNVNSAIAVVTVEDTVLPTVITHDVTIQLNAGSAAAVTPAQVDNGSFDNCGIASMLLDMTDYDCTDVGPNTVVLTVTDVNGNVNTATAIVTVEDSIVPTVITQSIVAQLDAAGTVTITAADVDNGSYDNCGIDTMLLDVDTFDCTSVGPNTVTLTVTDVNGNVSTATAVVIVEDTVVPTVITQDIVAQLDATGTATITVSDIDNGSSDNCAIDTMVLDLDTFDCTNVGPNTVTLTVTDVNGNVNTATAVVTVEDTVLPTVITQDIVAQLDAAGTVTITPALVDDGSSDNCAIDKMVLDIDTFNCTNIGDNIVTLTITDINGNANAATAIITVEDSIVPTVITQSIVAQLDAAGTVTITAADVDNGSYDNCGIDTMLLDVDTFDCTSVGPNTVTLTVTDVNGNVSTATAVVTVEDTVLPTVVTQPITVQLDATGTATITVSDIDNGSSDNCAIDTMVLDLDTFDCTNVGPNTITLTVTDVNGNVNTATAVVTVEDTVLPTVVTQDIVAQLDAAGTVTITPALVDNGSSDNCAIDTMVLDIDTFNCTNIGDNIVTLTVTDINGNANAATATVTVEDIIVPTVITQDIIAQLDAAGTVTITAADVDNGSYDNCGIDTMLLDVDTFDCTSIGPNTVTLTVTDVNGNVSTATAVVTVEDIIVPTVITQDIIAQLDATGAVTITTADVDNGSYDNCGIDTMLLDVDTFDCTSVGPNTVTLTVTDINGNVNTATAVVTVEDIVLPTVITQDIVAQLDAAGTVTITPDLVDNGSSDNCSIDTMVLDVDTFDCTNLGGNTVTMTVTDVNGNANSATAIVTVEDSIDPVAIAQDIVVQLDAVTGLATITPAQIDNGSSDNCTFTLSLDITDFDCTNTGANNVVLTVTDSSGNTATATAVVTVEDVTPPTVLVQTFNLPLNPNGEILLIPDEIDAGSFDNCEIVSRTVTPNLFSCGNLGDHTVTLTVIDASGNSAQATTTITVIDNNDPDVVTQNITVQLGQNGTVTITPAQIDNGSEDNCSIVSRSLDVSTFTCANIGANTVTLSVTDVGGNTSTGTAVVTVQDVTGPLIVPQPVTIDLDANGVATLTVADVDGGTADNCGIQSITLSKTAFDCGDLGTNTIGITATDIHGNVSHANVVVTVADPVAPVAVAQTIDVMLNTNGFVTITPDMINNGSTDNCGIDSMSLDIDTFGCADIGPNNVVLTVTDESGNTDTANATVNILPVPEPTTTAATQEFCAIDDPRLFDIEMTSDFVFWFADDTTPTPLAHDTPLADGIYFAATRYGANCYSVRIPVEVVVNNPPAPTGDPIQFFCNDEEHTVAELNSAQTVVWYETSTGGVPLSASTGLEHNQTYYAALVDGDCESMDRLPVKVMLRYCDVKVNNAVSANGDGRNDRFMIEGAQSFTDSKLEIFNRYGVTVYTAERYGQDGKFFTGYTNTGLGAGGNGLLPAGTYYYVFSFTNHDGQSMTKSGFLHLTY